MKALLAGLALLLSATTFAATAEEALWKALREGGHVALMRHAIAPGVGDPPGFRLDDCATQRNLSAAGRRQAQAIGERFRANGIAQAAVHASRWCRARDTARLLALGPVTLSPGLDSFFGARSAESDHVAAMRALIARHVLAARDGVPLVMVTHQVNITALSGVFPASGEIIVLRVAGDALHVAGRIGEQD
jgi:broad specificity phosphatase PhoE